MFQLTFDKTFTKIIREIPHWKTQEDIPDKIQKFIIETSDKRVIYEESSGKFYCGKCTEELDVDNYCSRCGIQHRKYTLDDLKYQHIDINDIGKKMASKISDLNNNCNYFVFDVVGSQVYLYLIKEEITYYNPLASIPYKNSTISIDTSNSYLIEKDGVTNLETNDYISFKALDDYRKKSKAIDDESKMYKLFDNFELDYYAAYMYTDNLFELKNTIYRYSKIWELGPYLKNQNYFYMVQFTFQPLYYPQFEYLINYKLYDLAWNIPSGFEKGKNFKEIFGVDKKYLPFMQKTNISYEELRVLWVSSIADTEILKFFSGYFWDSELRDLVKESKVNLKELKTYLEDKKLSSYVYEYFDYLHMAKELQLDITDKTLLYPENLREAHDELYNQIEVVNDPVVDEKIKNLSHLLTLNRYEDEEYVIYPVSSIKDLVEESRQQKNCVRTYCNKVANNESQIYFMRKKAELDKSLVTIEVKDKRITQARVKYNELPNDEFNTILKKWEQNLISIVNDN